MQNILLFLVSLTITPYSQAYGSKPTREQVCCLALHGLFPAEVNFQGSGTYTNETHKYFSAANFVQPACVFLPATAAHVSYAVQLFNKVKCNFAIRSGGHLPVPGSNGRNGAVLLATSKLNHVKFKGSVAKIGPGNTWIDVYRKTDLIGQVVPDGRVGSVGVGGLVLGGGVSFQQSDYGFACDNVVNFQVVTADGKIRNANAISNPDLFWALKGGGNRFGIVTSFDMKMYPLGRIYGGELTYQYSSLPEVLAQVDKYHGEDRDSKSSIIVNVIDANDLGYGQFVEVVLYYGKPVSSPPPVFQPFFGIPGLIANTVTTKPFSVLVPADKQGLPPGVLSHTWRSVTYQPSAAVNERVSDIFQEEVKSFREERGTDLQPGIFTLAYEPYSTGLTAASQRTGGNALGLDARKGPLMLALLTYSWTNQTESALRTAAVKKSVERMKAASLAAGKHIDWIYLNAAAPDQLPYQSYGKGNFERLRRVRDRYDPKGVFSKLQSGGFPL
ncbi:hypothetical protein H072_4401 [Dactylellina haptotyla CBS 200.50]|uniref:FAD-binding PCMH-type domain-containing protein n=1 Tax=Dactylellina haptotyla (strain CBS 200.50) TaxID=1284197 RepID=S8AFL3_DACHA|nr:hypothetical protein H072_4401 [Dactylellina haptotyla CBS 200.50]